MRNFDNFWNVPLVAILRNIAPELSMAVMNCLQEQNFKLAEVPLNSDKALQSIAKMTEHAEQMIWIGAGTVTSVEQVKLVHQAGGSFIVSPNTNTDVIKETKNLGMVSIPGCVTPTEAFTALEAGADALKIFPAEMVTPNAFKAIDCVLPAKTKSIIVGGINENNMSSYLRVGAQGFGIGSNLFHPQKSIEQIEQAAHRIFSAFQHALAK